MSKGNVLIHSCASCRFRKPLAVLTWIHIGAMAALWSVLSLLITGCIVGTGFVTGIVITFMLARNSLLFSAARVLDFSRIFLSKAHLAWHPRCETLSLLAPCCTLWFATVLKSPQSWILSLCHGSSGLSHSWPSSIIIDPLLFARYCFLQYFFLAFFFFLFSGLVGPWPCRGWYGFWPPFGPVLASFWPCLLFLLLSRNQRKAWRLQWIVPNKKIEKGQWCNFSSVMRFGVSTVFAAQDVPWRACDISWHGRHLCNHVDTP